MRKNAAITCLINRMNTYPITDTSKNYELQHTKTILHNKNYPTYKHLKKQKTNHTEQNTPTENKDKNGPPLHISEKKQEPLQDYLKTQTYEHNSRSHIRLKNHLKQKSITRMYISKESGIYQLKCNNCPLKCKGQTGRNFGTRFKVHIQAMRANKPHSKYVQHILDTQHTRCNRKKNNGFTSHSKKGLLLNIPERFHIHNLSTKNYKWTTHIQTYITLFST
jgi:hypothetical protein